MTKYTTNKLQPADVRHAKPQEKLYRLRDGGGLSLDVFPNGKKVWRYAYRLGAPRENKAGKVVVPQKTFTIGNYPSIGLSDARKLRDDAKQKVKSGIDPSQERQIEKARISGSSFRRVADEWFSENRAGWSEGHSSRIAGYLKRDINRALGHFPIDEIAAPHIIPIIKQVRDRGAIDAAKRVKGFIQQVFDYAVVHGYVDRNPAKDINTSLILPKRIKEEFAAITDPVQVGQLLRNIETYGGGLSVRSILKLSPHLFLRPSELKDAEWQEIDLGQAVWILPAKRRKLPTHVKQANRSNDALIIPLSSQVVEMLGEVRRFTGQGVYVFPSPKGTGRTLSNNAVRSAIRSMGYDNDEMTTHGFRALASTLLNELGHDEKLIELQLGHVWGNAVKRAYDRSGSIEKRTAMMQAWSDYLEGLRAGADVVPFNRNKAV